MRRRNWLIKWLMHHVNQMKQDHEKKQKKCQKTTMETQSEAASFASI